ncbi:hypothetical protein ACN469_00465 [Corallococcus terminator]
MKDFLSIHLPLVLTASLLSVACGSPMEERAEGVDQTVLAQDEQALAPLAVSITCSSQGITNPNFFTPSFRCTGTGSGGGGNRPTYSFAWTALTNSFITSQKPGLGTSEIGGYCNPNVSAEVQVTITDSLGATATTTQSFFCFAFVG